MLSVLAQASVLQGNNCHWYEQGIVTNLLCNVDSCKNCDLSVSNIQLSGLASDCGISCLIGDCRKCVMDNKINYGIK